MAKVSGQLHSDLAKGSIGPVTHRVYRGTGTASKHRAPSRKRLTKLTIKSPLDIGNCWSRHSADIGYTLRIVPPDAFLKSLSDQVGGFGTLSQLDDVRQPLWFPSDSSHNNRPYIIPDGLNDYMFTLTNPVKFGAPFDIWAVMYDCGHPSASRAPLCFASVPSAHLNCSTNPALQWVWQAPPIGLLANWSDATCKVWRIVFDQNTIQMFWNGVAQSPPKIVPSQLFDLLQIFASIAPAGFYNNRLFEITTFRRILNPVEAQLLLHYLFDFYNLP